MSMPVPHMTDDELREQLMMVVKCYAERAEANGRCVTPLIEHNAITATEAVMTICELMHASDLNPFDVAMWYRRDMPEIPQQQQQAGRPEFARAA